MATDFNRYQNLINSHKKYEEILARIDQQKPRIFDKPKKEVTPPKKE